MDVVVTYTYTEVACYSMLGANTKTITSRCMTSELPYMLVKRSDAITHQGDVMPAQQPHQPQPQPQPQHPQQGTNHTSKSLKALFVVLVVLGLAVCVFLL